MFRLCEMQLQLGFVIFSSNDTLMLFLVPWLKGTFPFLFCFSSSDSTPAPLFPRMSLVCTLWQRGGEVLMTSGAVLGVNSSMLPSGGGISGCPFPAFGLFSVLRWQKGPKINYRKSSIRRLPDDYRVATRGTPHQLFYLPQFLSTPYSHLYSGYYEDVQSTPMKKYLQEL